MSNQRTRDEWAHIVQAWRASGQSAERFARARGLGPNSLRRWSESLGYEPRFVRLEVGAKPSKGLTIEVGSARVVVESGFDRALLRAVVEALS